VDRFEYFCITSFIRVDKFREDIRGCDPGAIYCARREITKRGRTPGF
jgi:hypothetical protein